MQWVWNFLLAGAIASSAVAAETDVMARNQSAEVAKLEVRKKAELKYLLALPKGYDAKKGKKWPLMIFLHGAGERGTNLNKVAVHGPPKLVAQGKEFPFILISPQCPNGKVWDPELVIELLNQAVKKYRVDEGRVYLTGLSMGGFGSWATAIAYPDRFAAVAPICGGGNVISVLLPAGGKEKQLKSLPIWAFHGAKDTVVTLDESERMVNAFKRGGNSGVKLTVYPEAGHDSWTETYNNAEVFEWFLKQSRP